MPLISGTVPSLINGISQQPATLRMPTQGEVQRNGFSHISRGLEKRSCTEHVSEIIGVNSTNSNDVFIHTIRRSEDEAYALIVKGGTGVYKGDITIDSTNNTIDLTNHGITENQPVYFLHGTNGNLTGSGLSPQIVYYAKTIQTSNFQLSTTEGGSTLNLTSPSQSIGSVRVYVGQPPILKLYDLTGFATGNPGDEVFIHKTKQSGVVSANGDIDFNASDYISNFTASGNDVFAPNKLSVTTVADFSFILNKTQTVKKKTNETHATSNYQAVVYIKTGDFNADYKVKVTVYTDKEMTNVDSSFGTNGIKEVTFHTPDNQTKSGTGDSAESETLSINNQNAVVVSNIARALWNGSPATDVVPVQIGFTGNSGDKKAQIQRQAAPNAAYTGTKGVISTGSVTTDGAGLTHLGTPFTTNSSYVNGESLIYLESTKPFTVECTDGKGDSFMVAINASDEVPNFGSLPASKIPEDFVAKISGDKSSGQDDYYVKWNGSVYKETFRPKYPLDNPQDSRKALDKTTMPMQLFKQFDSNNNIYFVLQPIDFAERTVGDDTTNPFPSFADYDDTVDPNGVYKINDIFFHRNRLGFISDENVILSEAANYFNFFANTVLSVLDTSVVDVAVSNNQVAILKSAIPFQENLLLFSDLQQFKLTSDEFLTPTSVTVNVATNFETSTEAKPVAAGKTIFFPFQRGAFSGIREYMIDVASETNDANEVTSHVPELVAGTVKKMAVSSNEEVLCVLSDTDRSELYIYKYYYSDKEKLQSSWSSWKFDADIIDMEFIGSVAFFLFRRGTKIYLEKLNLSVDNATTIMDDKIGVRLDRRVKLQATTITDYTPTVADAASGHISNLTITNAGSGYSGDGTLSFTGGGGTNFQGTYTVSNGSVATVTITSKGSGYTSAPTIVLQHSPASGGTPAVITATVNKKWEENKKHTNVSQTSSSNANASGIKFNITTDSLGNPTFEIADNGNNYAKNDTVVFTDPGISSNTATVTIDKVGTQISLSEYYSDVQHDKVGTAIEKTISSVSLNDDDNIDTTSIFTSNAHDLLDGYRVHITSTGTLPTPLVADTKYFIVSKTANTFKLSKSPEGEAIKITVAGSGTIKAVFDDTKVKGVLNVKETNLQGTDVFDDQFGKKITINNVTKEPRVGQRFTSSHDKFNTYTVTSVGDLENNSVEIEITPSIASAKEPGQGGPVPHLTAIVFQEREKVYVVETGEVIKESEVIGALRNGSPYSKARGNTTPAIFAGVPYDFEYTFSEQFVKSGEDSINSGRLQMRNFEISYDRSGFFQVEVAPKPFDDRLRKINVRSFTGRKIGSLFLGKQELDTGVFRVPVYVNSKDVKISVLSDSWLPLALQSADYEAYQVLRNQRI